MAFFMRGSWPLMLSMLGLSYILAGVTAHGVADEVRVQMHQDMYIDASSRQLLQQGGCRTPPLRCVCLENNVPTLYSPYTEFPVPCGESYNTAELCLSIGYGVGGSKCDAACLSCINGNTQGVLAACIGKS